MPAARLFRFCLTALLALITPCAAASVLDDVLHPNPPVSGGMCMPSVTAPPCAQGDAAGQASAEPSLNLGIGNPVHLATGAKHQFDVDLPASLAHPDLEIVRHYNSMRPTDSPLGTGWRFSYDTRVVVHQGAARIEQANGATLPFDAHGDSRGYGSLQRTNPGWQWIWPDARVLDFDADGYLIRIRRHANAPATEIVRHQGALVPAIAQVRSGAGSLQFVYAVVQGRVRLTAIDSPAGRFSYQMEGMTGNASSAMRLTAVTRPDGMQRRYLYEAQYQDGNAGLPTGVVLVQPAADQRETRRLRISAWDYDAAGRAVGVSFGERTAADGYSRIRYLRKATAARDGVTLVDSPAGKTRFTITLRAGQPHLLKVEGAGCPGCAPSGLNASYDAQGRLLSINGARIERDASGQPLAVEPHAPGWPGLRITLSASGARRQWQSALTGLETVQDHASTRSAVRQFANGDRMDVSYDAQGRPLRIRESRGSPSSVPARDAMTTILRWRDGNLHCVQHPFATEGRTYDAQGRLIARTELRRLSTPPDAANDAGLACDASGARTTADRNVWRTTETFVYDAQNRLTTHVLPEGGSIHYDWGEGERLHAITWEDATGRHHPVIARVANAPGYRYGNGLHLYAAHAGRNDMTLTLLDAAGGRWQQTRTQDARGRVLRETYALRLDAADAPAPPAQHDWRTLEDWQYAYDAQDRLIGAREASGSEHWLAWQPDGALAAIGKAAAPAETRVTVKPAIARDPAGLPGAADDLVLTYGANRRLTAVSRQGKPLAHYAHNAWGQRIRTQMDGRVTDYLTLDNRRVAEIQVRSNGEPAVIRRRYLYAHDAPVGMIVYSAETGGGELYAIHADLLGAPRMVTDTKGAIRWLASYTPLGEARQVAGDLTLDLRLPGQWFDAATGLHDNGLRTYAPQWGQYLEPDPLGPVPGSQALGYGVQQPRRFVDPLGLLLFAFDGTRHSMRTHSNVLKLLQSYQDGPAYYHGGPGNPYTLDWDALVAFSAPRILEAQWFNLLVALKQANASPWMRDANTGAIPIDVIGFSRGAALARHFGNQIVAHTRNGRFSFQHDTLGLISACVDLRFMGLMDTVAQFGVLGRKDQEYDLRIAEVWRWVSHAVALHEYSVLFPLTSMQAGTNPGRVEAPFIGVHGDIGGGNLLDPDDTLRRGDLSDVALNWLWWQAQAAGIPIKPLNDEDRRVSDAIINMTTDYRRDELIPPSTPVDPWIQFLPLSDRSVLAPDSERLYWNQNNSPSIGYTQRSAVVPLIHKELINPLVIGYRVNMDDYRAWLRQTLDWGEQLGAP